MPEDADPGNPIFKPITEPSRLDSLLVVNQMSNYTKQISRFSSGALQKLFAMEALATTDSPGAGRS